MLGKSLRRDRGAGQSQVGFSCAIMRCHEKRTTKAYSAWCKAHSQQGQSRQVATGVSHAEGHGMQLKADRLTACCCFLLMQCVECGEP